MCEGSNARSPCPKSSSGKSERAGELPGESSVGARRRSVMGSCGSFRELDLPSRIHEKYFLLLLCISSPVCAHIMYTLCARVMNISIRLIRGHQPYYIQHIYIHVMWRRGKTPSVDQGWPNHKQSNKRKRNSENGKKHCSIVRTARNVVVKINFCRKNRKKSIKVRSSLLIFTANAFKSQNNYDPSSRRWYFKLTV